MKILWGIISIVTTVVCFFLGSLLFSFQVNQYFVNLVGSSLGFGQPGSIRLFFIPGIIFYALGILSIYLLFKKKKIAFGYIVSVVCNIILLLILTLSLVGPSFDFFWAKFIIPRLCAIGAQEQHVDTNIYDVSNCYVNRNFQVKIFPKLK